MDYMDIKYYVLRIRMVDGSIIVHEFIFIVVSMRLNDYKEFNPIE